MLEIIMVYAETGRIPDFEWDYGATHCIITNVAIQRA